MTDYTNSLPDECLTLIFNYLTTTNDRNNSSLVSHRWLRIDAQTRRHLTLKAHSDLQPFIPSIFTRFNSLTKLVLDSDPDVSHMNDPNYFSINDHGLSLIASLCPNLTCLKLRHCPNITYNGMLLLSQNCTKLKKFTCSACVFGSKGIITLLNNCSSLEELSAKNITGEVVFEPLIICLKNLRTLKLKGCDDWCLQIITSSPKSLVEVYLKYVDLCDIGLLALSKFSSLQVLHLEGLAYCTDTVLISIIERCKYLKKLYIDNDMFKTIQNDVLIAIAKYCSNLEELVLIGVDTCCISLEAIVVNCQKLERLDLCSSETITDVEISHIAEKCVALKKVFIKECGVSDIGVEAFALGCPNLVEIGITDCKNVTRQVKDRLKARRRSLVVKLDEDYDLDMDNGVKRRDENATDLVVFQTALSEYETQYGQAFTLESCWRILKDVPVWTEVEAPTFNRFDN